MAEPLGIVSSVIGGISLVSGAVSRVMATSESLKIVESFEQRSKFKAEIVEIAILDSLVFEVRAALYEPGQVSGRVSGPIVMVESSCNESQEQVHHLLATMNKSSRLPESKSRGTTRSRKGNFATELNALVEVYRKYAFLLRDLCAEKRMHDTVTELKQLNKEFIKASAMPSENLSKLDDNGYRMIAYVKADHLDISKGKHFGVILAEVQLDTGAEVDLVSEEFLLKKLGLNESMWKSIPEEDQGPIGGFYAEGYTPKYQVELHWSQRNGGEFDKAKFYVIKGCRKDLVFQQSRFLKESGLQPHVCVAAKGGSKDEDKRRIAEGIETVKQFNQRSKEAHEKQMQGLQGFEQIQRTARALSDELQDDQKPIARDTDGSDTMERQPTMREEVPSDGPQNLKDSESDMATPSLRSQASVKTRHGWPSMTGLKKKIGRRSTQDKEGNA